MKVKIFYEEWGVVESQFNEWAKGLALPRGTIIHTHVDPSSDPHRAGDIFIIVFYPEGSQFDTKG